MSINNARTRRAARSGRAGLMLLAGVLLLVALAGLLAWWLGWLPKILPQRPTIVKLAPQQLSEVLEQRNVAIAYLENHKHDDARPLFANLGQLLPSELLPIQNSAICNLNAISAEADEQRKAELFDLAQADLKKLLEKSPTAAAANYLMAQLLYRLPPTSDETEQAERIRQIIAHCEKAAQDQPEEPGIWWLIYLAVSSAGDPNFEGAMENAVRKAYSIAPDNLRLLREMLLLQSRKREPEITATLQHARQLLGPLLLSMKSGDNVKRDDGARSTGIEFGASLDQAIQAASANDWDTVDQHVRDLVNSGLMGLIIHRDESVRLELNPLEFVVYDFSKEFYERNPVPAVQEIKDVSFRFAVDQNSAVPTEKKVVEVRLSDADLDRVTEMIVLHEDEIVVYRRDEGAATSIMRAPLPFAARGVLAADLDNDHLEAPPYTGPDARIWHTADPDFVIYGAGGIQVLMNVKQNDGSRTLQSLEAGQLPSASPADVQCALLVDFDHDADLDLVLGTKNGIQLWSGRGNGGFEDVTHWSNLPDADLQPTALKPVDWDRDADIDIVIANPASGKAGLLQNLQHGHLEWMELPNGFEAVGSASDIAVAELDGNASWDVVVAGPKGVHVIFTATAAPRKVQAVKTVALTDERRNHIVVGDLDNNAYPDILTWTDAQADAFLGGPNQAYHRSAEGILPAELEALDRLLLQDIDQDGDLDALGNRDGQATVLRNDGGNTANWMQLRLVGDCDNSGCVGHTGTGSMLEIKAGNRYQAQVIVDEVTHFGLGRIEQADVLRIIPTNGVPQALIKPAINQYLTEEVTLTGSCPYLYTWNGRCFEFVTDCLWAAPVGMQTSRGNLMPARDWEYLLIAGEKLRERNGTYDLQITEELWEAAYFDHVELLTVDHPADVAVYSNEKVGPPDIAEFKVHTVSKPRLPVSAVDQHGQDVLAAISSADGKYLSAWDTFIRRGLTSEHYVELDLGQLAGPKRIMLYLTGWIMPAGTSLHLHYSQNPNLDLPRLPAVWTPDASGQWREAIGYMGFPGGKTKTIAVDVSQAFANGDYRLRILTTAQIYWDHVFFTVDEPEKEVRIQSCELATADLHFRGFSKRSGYDNNGPEVYDYTISSTDPRWPPMRGKFTRYGDVRELLTAADDQLAIFGSGDEMTLQFNVPAEPLPAGWKRDFILHSVGWDKDADLNTILGQTVEPLPYRGMREYPYDPARGPQGPEYEKYLEAYQTREQDQRAFWWWLKRWGE